MSKISNIEEARKVLECLSSTLIRAIIAMVIGDIKRTSGLAEALDISIRNAQRIVVNLERYGVVKTFVYGRSKIILSVNKYFEAEILKAVETLIPYVISSIDVPLNKLEERILEILRALVSMLGIRMKPKGKIISLTREIITSGDLGEKPLPRWLKRIITAEPVLSMRIRCETAKQHPSSMNIPLLAVGEVNA